MNKENEISNWTIFGVQSALIELHKYVDDDHTYYNSALSIFLDDGAEECDKNVTLITNVYNECPHCCIVETLQSSSQLFDICDDVYTINDSGDIIEEYKISDILAERESGNSYSEEVTVSSTHTLH